MIWLILDFLILDFFTGTQ